MYVPQITFTRFLASISIVVLHYGLFTWPMNSSILSPFAGNYVTAMSYFFILSGFVLVISAADNEILPDKINRRSFWIRRAARILPVYLLALVIYFAINFRYDPSIPLYWQVQSYFHSLFLVQSWRYDLVLDVNYPSWSLSVEAFFYFIFPWLYMIVRTLKNKSLLIISGTVWLLNLYIYYSLKQENVPENFLNFFPVLHVATFLTGICFGILFIRNYKWLATAAKKYIYAATLVVTLFVVYTAYKNYGFYKYQHNGLLSPFYLLIILSLSITKGKIGAFLSSKPLVFLGSISYSVYILQYPIYQICQKYLPWFSDQTKEDLFYPYVIVLLLVSSVVYLFFEKPARKYIIKRKLSQVNTKKYDIT